MTLPAEAGGLSGDGRTTVPGWRQMAPRPRTLSAALTSAWSRWPQTTPASSACDGRDRWSTAPQAWPVRDGLRGSTATTTGPAASAWPWSVARYGRRPQRPPASRGDYGSRPRSPVQPSHGVAAAPQPCQSEAQVRDLPAAEVTAVPLAPVGDLGRGAGPDEPVGVIGHDPPSQHPPPRACPPSRSSASSAGPAARQPRL